MRQAVTEIRKGTILLVDDEESLLALGVRMLEHSGFSVLTAADGLQAVGWGCEDVASRFAGKGLDGVLQKPYTLAKLRESLAGLMPKRTDGDTNTSEATLSKNL